MTDTAKFDPAQHTVPDVLAYLESLGDTQERADEADRIHREETAGQARVGILGVISHTDGTEEVGTITDPAAAVTTTKASTFTEAAEEAIVDERAGALGTSAEAERTGRRDKGLSQRNPAIMTGGPIPDPRRGVDDSAGLAALADLDG